MEEERLNLKEDMRPQKNKLLIVFFILTPLLLGFLIVLVLLLNSGGGGLFDDPLRGTQPRFVEPIQDYQVNLADTGGRRYLRIRFEVGFNESRLQKELESRESEIRSEIIALLRSKTAEDLQEPGGQSMLKDEIIIRMNDILVSGEVRDLYYTEFIIQ